MIKIKEMTMRLSGMQAEEGNLLRSEVMRLVAQQIPPHSRAAHIDQMNVTITLRPGMGRSEQAQLIAAAIIQKINTVQE